ncbi:glycoside hydrolase family 15 protein [Pseudomonas sp. PDM14]|uniref:glycoside hydrolase family 15 protein n=1 Tax=Pseudomonas sp. PDM14 TaxID=2769288 RepID=UPI0017800797|nr:glycoside hydrolase family 15 protein [Pseudomonas sp. PDM14]MBD9484470.1 glycoside hydrolase family 15 protein [Pseudomonas sp. PDM14]
MADWRAAAQNPIEAHGIIGDMRSAALVADTGCIDFCCWPEFDSPSIFTALLDTPEAGIFQLAPDLPEARREQLYLPDSNVLRTSWIDREAIVELTDFMPINATAEAMPRLIRIIRVAHGRARIRLYCRPRHDYGRAQTEASLHEDDVWFEAHGQPTLRLSCTRALQVQEHGALAEFELGEGEQMVCVLGAVDDPLGDASEDVLCLDETLAFWRNWIGASNYRGRWREMVSRSALALKLLTSRKAGGIVAAATFGLPETPGGERNWDYRYTWIRDASFTVYAFMRLGFVDEANHFMRWVRGRVDDCCHHPTKLHILYGLDGRVELPEEDLDHLAGYGGARPVRIGNEAHTQVQLDIFGELLDAVYLANKYGEAISYEGWQHVTAVVDEVCATWQEKDVGIWEIRDEPQHFLHSRLMCWVALDRALRLAFKRSLPAPFERWDTTRQAIHDDIWSNFWDAERGHFVQHSGSTHLDGSMLLMPLMRFVGATDPRWLSTLEAIEHELVRDSRVFRYSNDDGLPGEEGAFVACSFWYVECLARAGRVREANLTFERMLRYANPLGLFAEEVDHQGRHLGNTPQALSHLALISAASFLDHKLSGEKTLWQP